MLKYLAGKYSITRERAGSAAVEFAYTAPVLFLIVLATLDFGRLAWITSSLDTAAREGVRFASIRGSTSSSPATQEQVIAYVRNRIAIRATNELTVSVTWNPNSASGSQVTVVVAYPFSFVMAGFLNLEPLQVTGTSQMIVL